MPPRRRRRRLLLAVLALTVLVGGAGAVAAWQLLGRDGDVLNPDVPFGEATGPRPAPTPAPRRKRARPVAWPLYGFGKRHQRFFRPRRPLRGPWRMVWRHRAPALLEFPPVIFRGAMYQLADNGVLFSLRTTTGRVRWKRRLGTLSASSPAVGGGSVYATVLERRRGSGRGRVVALRRATGRIRWSRSLPSRAESSPLLHRGRIVFGTENGAVYKLDAHTGRTVWRYRAGGAVKGSPALADGKLYFGDYSGAVHAIRASTGRRVWMATPARRAVRSGRFYATPAVAFGRVYIGATDGRQYSLSARDGRLAWARETGGYVYSSAAVHDVEGLGPAVFFGSYDGNLYALSARTGRTLWRHRSGGRISGSPTIVGGTVYFSDLGRSSTTGLRTRNGKVVFRRGIGAFDPIVSDGRHLFLTGRSSVTALLPRRAAGRRQDGRRPSRTRRRGRQGRGASRR